MDISDKILVKYCKAGIKKFCNQIYKKYYKLVFSIAYGIVRNQDMAEEIMQDVFLKAFTAIKNYRNDNALKNWLAIIAKNRSLDVMKKSDYKLRKKSESTDKIPEGSDANGKKKNTKIKLPDESLSADTLKQIEKKEKIQLVIKRITKLDEKHRIVIILFYIKEMTSREIAEMLKINENTVRSRLFNAIKKLKY